MLNRLHRTRVLWLSGGWVMAACTSAPPTTEPPYSQQDRVRTMVLYMAGDHTPGCKEPKVVATNVVQVWANGESAEELWTVDACGTPKSFVVTFPQKKEGYLSPGFSVKPKP